MALTNFVDFSTPAVNADYLNQVDRIREVTTVPAGLTTMTIGSSTVLGVTANGDGGLTAGFTITANTPQFNFIESNAAANEKIWSFSADGGQLRFRTVTDAGVSTNWMTVDRTAGVLDNVTVHTPLILNSSGASTTATALQLSSNQPTMFWQENDAAANNRIWDISAQGEQLLYRVATDAYVTANYMVVDRTAGAVDSVTFPAPTVYTSSNPQILINATTPEIVFIQSGAAVDNRRWDIVAASEQLLFRAVNDAAGTANSFQIVDRTGATVDSVTYPSQCIFTSAQTAGPVTSPVYMNSNVPGIGWREADAAANNQLWDIIANGTQWLFRLANDAGTANNIWTLTRSGNTCTQIIGQTDTHSLRNSSNLENFNIASGGAVYFPRIATTASAANAFLNSGSSPANEIQRSTSSIRYKTDVQDLPTGNLAKLLQLRPITYRSLCPGDDKNKRWLGLIAEEVAEVEPRLIEYSFSDEEKAKENPADWIPRPESVMYDRLTVMLLAVLKEQAAQITALETRLSKLEVVKVP